MAVPLTVRWSPRLDRRGTDALLLDVCGRGDLRVGRLCPACGSTAHGRPLLSGGPTPPQVSISHTDTVTVVAVSATGAVGVDVEPASAAGSLEATRAWVRVEAALKASGHGLRGNPDQVALDDRQVLAWPEGVEVAGAAWWLDLPGIPGHVGAVVVLAAAPPVLEVREAPGAPGSPARHRTTRPGPSR